MNLDSGLIGILYKLFRPVELLITYILSFWHKIFVFLGMPDGSSLGFVGCFPCNSCQIVHTSAFLKTAEINAQDAGFSA